jgi:Fe(II)/alpha-ketoglutarate-dependent arginine beta-hydroxylase
MIITDFKDEKPLKQLCRTALDHSEILMIESLIEKLQSRFETIEQEQFADYCTVVAHEMPFRLRKLFNDFRNKRMNDGYLLLEGFSVNDEVIGLTPSHWDAPWINAMSLREEIFQCLISSSLGDIFGWQTQENGRYLRHIVPIKTDRNEQLGGSSDVVLMWHVEEAFHPQRADMMTIMCYRNEEKASTNICSLSDLDIPDHYREVLSQPRFTIQPDKSHSPENNKSSLWHLDEDHFNKIRAFMDNPQPVSVLQGRKGEEQLLIDEAFMEPLAGDFEAKEVLEWFHRHLNERKHAIVMNPGDLLIIDNRITVHGRSSYKPNYGPKARWLRRVNITADLRKSYQWKDTAFGRVIF